MEQFLMWGLGLCVTGFLFLLIKIWNLNNEVKDRPSYDWVDDKIKEEFHPKLVDISAKLTILNDAIIGTVDKKGIITKIHEHDDKIEDLIMDAKVMVTKFKQKEKL